MKPFILLVFIICACLFLVYEKMSPRQTTQTAVGSARKTAALQPSAEPAEPEKQEQPATKWEAAWSQENEDGFFRNQEQLQVVRQNSTGYYRRNKQQNDELKSLNPSWDIQKLWPQGDSLQDIYVSADDCHGNVYFVTSDEFDYKIYKAGEGDEVKEQWTFPRMNNGAANLGYLLRMKIHSGTALITEGRYVWVSLPEQKILHRISGFPARITDVWKQNGRIMLLGEKFLMSCDLLGKNRQVHFAAGQTDKTLPVFDESPDFSFFAGGPGRNDDEAVLFSLGNGAVGVYSLSEGKYRKSVNLPPISRDQCHYSAICRNGTYLFSMALKPAGAVQFQCLYSAESDSLKIIGGRSNPYIKKFWSNMPEDTGVASVPEHCIAGVQDYRGQVLLYAGGHGRFERDSTPGNAGIMDMNRYPDGINLKYPSVNGLYFHNDGKSLWAVEYYQLTRISPVTR